MAGRWVSEKDIATGRDSWNVPDIVSPDVMGINETISVFTLGTVTVVRSMSILVTVVSSISISVTVVSSILISVTVVSSNRVLVTC